MFLMGGGTPMPTMVFPYCYTSKVDQRMVNTVLMIKINPACKRLLIFIIRKKKRPGLYHQYASNKLLNMFFHRCSFKITCFSELA